MPTAIGPSGLRTALCEIAARRGVDVEAATYQRNAATPLADGVIAAVGEAIAACGQAPLSLTSGAGMMPGFMARHCPAGMTFLRCKDGISHNPAESITAEDAEVGVRALLEATRRLDHGWRGPGLRRPTGRRPPLSSKRACAATPPTPPYQAAVAMPWRAAVDVLKPLFGAPQLCLNRVRLCGHGPPQPRRDRGEHRHRRRFRQGHAQARPPHNSRGSGRGGRRRARPDHGQAVQGKPGITPEIGRRLLAAALAPAPPAATAQGHASAVVAEPTSLTASPLAMDARRNGEAGSPVVPQGGGPAQAVAGKC
jgi:hypothetical protein